jgi:hypothetical protein
MWWLTLLVLAGVAAMLFVIFRYHRFAIAHPQFNEYLNISGFALNVVLFALSLLSLFVAVKTYRDAVKSGVEQTAALKRQQESLDAARSALDASASTAKQQAKLLEGAISLSADQLDAARREYGVLDESLSTARAQFNILKDEYQRALERPDLRLAFVYPQVPAVIVENVSSSKTANDIRYEVRLWKLDGSGCQLYAAPVMPIDFATARQRVGPLKMEVVRSCIGEPSEPPHEHDKLFGYVSLWCSDCAGRHQYWLYFDWGKAAYSARGTESEFANAEREGMKQTAERFLKRHDIKPFQTQP